MGLFRGVRVVGGLDFYFAAEQIEHEGIELMLAESELKRVRFAFLVRLSAILTLEQ